MDDDVRRLDRILARYEPEQVRERLRAVRHAGERRQVEDLRLLAEARLLRRELIQYVAPRRYRRRVDRELLPPTVATPRCPEQSRRVITDLLRRARGRDAE